MKSSLPPWFSLKIPLFLSLLLLLAPVQAATVVWTNTAGGNWSLATNWSPNAVPAGGDTVVITNDGTYAVTVDASPTLAALTVGATNGTQTLNLNTGILTINGASAFSTNTVFNLGGGTLAGGGTVTFNGAFNWASGTLSGAGTTVFASTATVNFSTANTKQWRQRTVDNYAGVTYSGGGLLADYLAVWNNMGGATFLITGDFGIGYGGLVGYATFNNYGTFRKSAGSGFGDMQLHMRNADAASIVRSQGGILGFSVSYIQTNGLTELAGGNFSGTLLDIRGGLLTGAGNVAANVSNGGQVAPGSGVGLLTITNTIPQTYTSTTNSLVTFQIGGLNPGSGHDQIRINSSATLAGTLRAALANGYIPTAGNTYTVMTFTARSGLFTNFSFLDYEFGVVQNTTNVILIASNALPAVQLTVPATQLVCTPFELQTSASDLDGTVTNLLVFLGADLLASFNSGGPHPLTVEYDHPGLVTFTARATDNKGAVRETNATTLYTTLPLHVLNLGGPRSNGVFKICMLGEAGSNYLALAATNLTVPLSNWTTLGTMEHTNGIWRHSDNGTLTNRAYRFYRAQQVP